MLTKYEYPNTSLIILQLYFYILQFFQKNRIIFYYMNFFKRSKKRMRYNYTYYNIKKPRSKLLFFNPYSYKTNNLTPTQNIILYTKRKFGLLKYRYSKKNYHLRRMSYYIDVYRQKKQKLHFHYHSLKKKHINKLFFKKNRGNIFENLGYNVNRQKRKSKVAYSLFRANKPLVINMKLIDIFLNHKMFFTISDTINFIKTFGIYLNYKTVYNPYINITKGDIIQIPMQEDPIYNMYRLIFFKKYRKYMRKIKPRIFKLMRNKIDLHKQATKNIPKWILRFFAYKELYNWNIEFDTLTYTFMVIELPCRFVDYNVTNNIMRSANMYRLYNWKYIV
mgnify:CR=1 FL=1